MVILTVTQITLDFEDKHLGIIVGNTSYYQGQLDREKNNHDHEINWSI